MKDILLVLRRLALCRLIFLPIWLRAILTTLERREMSFNYFNDNKFTGDLSQSIDMTLRDFNVYARCSINIPNGGGV